MSHQKEGFSKKPNVKTVNWKRYVSSRLLILVVNHEHSFKKGKFLPTILDVKFYVDNVNINMF